jgi:hypothetical protein
MAARETNVVSNTGNVLLTWDDPRIAGVVAIDIGVADLQQCADSAMRLHAEWLWSHGRRDITYPAATGTPMPYSKWAAGERVVADGTGIKWVMQSRPSTSHGSFREYLDAVFAWSNTVALDRLGKPVSVEDLRVGDLMVIGGNPGHTVVVMDMAEKGNDRVVLLGQGYMPAQSFQILRGAKTHAWFGVVKEDGGIQTPFWPKPFMWSTIRRID